MYKSFIRPYCDYRDVNYKQPSNSSVHQRLESIQYNAALALTGGIRGNSGEKLCQKLVLETTKMLVQEIMLLL